MHHNGLTYTVLYILDLSCRGNLRCSDEWFEEKDVLLSPSVRVNAMFILSRGKTDSPLQLPLQLHKMIRSYRKTHCFEMSSSKLSNYWSSLHLLCTIHGCKNIPGVTSNLGGLEKTCCIQRWPVVRLFIPLALVRTMRYVDARDRGCAKMFCQ